MTHSTARPQAAPVAELAVRRAQNGDVAAFREVYERHVGRVHALSVRMCGDAERAEELTQEIFVRAWKKLPQFRGDSSFATWVHRLAVNVILDALRRENPREIASEPGLNSTPPRQGRIDLERAVRALPTKARRVFILHDLEGYTHVEIGDFMGITDGTSRGQLHRARQLLREALR